MSEIKISIIIPSYNQGKFLHDTLQSIVDQQCDNVEIIVMDGGSNDNSVDVIKSFEPYIAYWQSQKDSGQSNAINNGFKMAQGEFVTWLNSDDVLLAGALNAVTQEIEHNPTCNFFLGNVLWMDKEGKVIRVGKVERENRIWNKYHLFSNGGPTAFMRKSTLEKIGWLREDFHYMMDTELWNRLIDSGNPFIRVDNYIWGLRLHEEAKMSGHNFANSILADKKHPSWIQKQKESTYLTETYPVKSFMAKMWRICKIFTPQFYTRFTDKGMLGQHYSNIIQN